jgi:response regulator of citrate/malate metabolism
MRRDPLEIIEKMFKALDSGRPFSINELAQETGLHNVTVRRYIRIIEVVREEPRVEVIKTRHSIIIRTTPVTRRTRIIRKEIE